MGGNFTLGEEGRYLWVGGNCRDGSHYREQEVKLFKSLVLFLFKEDSLLKTKETIIPL